ncbi:MAG TPA: hypothetical protein VHO02_04010 [Fibrobacteria bacterium]|nr:hypothetical protein [Fibrobacteria bacterium]
MIASIAVMSASAAPSGGVPRGDDFDAGGMTLSGTRSGSPSFSLAQPGRFSMHQSYSLTAMSSSQGSASSGLYLNTLSYQLAQPLVMFVDVGFYTPLHSTMPGMNSSSGAGSVVLPRMGLEYKPSERLTMNLELVNGPDAWKAYGGHWSPSLFTGSRTP